MSNKLEIIIAVLIGAAGIYDAIEKSSSTERERWRTKREEIERNIQWHNKQISNHIDNAQYSYNYKTLVDNHHSCMLTADLAYSVLEDAKVHLSILGESIVKVKKQREKLFEKKRRSTSSHQSSKIQQEINNIQELRKKLFGAQDEIKKRKNKLYMQVKELNNKTHNLKIEIRDSGIKGREWYERLEVRTSQKRK